MDEDAGESTSTSATTGGIYAADRLSINFFGLAKDAEAIKAAVDKWSSDGLIERQFRLSKWQTIPGTVAKILVNYSITFVDYSLCH